MVTIIVDQPAGDPVATNKYGLWKGPFSSNIIFRPGEMQLGRVGFLNSFEMYHLWVIFELPLESYDVVESCFIRLCRQHRSTSTATMFADITAHRVVNTDAPTSRADCVYQVGTNPTIAKIAWEYPANASFLQFDFTPDIKAIIDEIKGLDGWVKGNRIALYVTIRQEPTPYPNPNYVLYFVDEHDLGSTIPAIPNDTGLLPKLILTYTPGVPGSEPDSRDMVTDLVIEQVVSGYMSSGHVVQDLEIIQEYVVTKQRNRTVFTDLTIIQDVHLNGNIPVSVLHDLFIIPTLTRSHNPVKSVESVINFTQDLIRNGPLDKQIVHELDLIQENTVVYVHGRIVVSTIVLESLPASTTKQKTVFSFIEFLHGATPSGTFSNPNNVVSVLTFVQDIDFGADRTRGIESILTIQHSVLGFGPGTVCREDLEWLPRADGSVEFPDKPTIVRNPNFTLTYGGDDIVLRSPLFSDREEIFVERISRKTRGGDLKVFRDDQWLSVRTFRYKFEGLTNNQMIEAHAFLILTLGLKITILDHESLEWEGYIVNPQGESAEFVRICGNTMEFDFEGVRT
jgi:hypothetical protein